MRAGALDSIITVERSTTAPDDYGVPVSTWAPVVTARAQIIQASTEEYLRAAGASDETVVIFRTRYIEGLMTADRIVCDGDRHDIKEVKELGRRRGLEIRTVLFGEVTT